MKENVQSRNHRPFSITMTRKDGKRVVKSFIRASDLAEYFWKHSTHRPSKATPD